MIGRNDPCWCGSGKKWKKCHYPEVPSEKPQAPSLKELKRQYLRDYDIIIKDTDQLKGIRAACQLAASILEKTCAMAKAGVTTKELNDFADDLHKTAGATPASLYYGHPPFPGSICTSLNEVICHGIPSDEKLKDGDILNIDVACVLNGFYGDCSQMVKVGDISDERQLVCDTAYECLMQAVDILRPGLPLKEIGEAITSHAESRGCSVVHQFVAHGVGCRFHEGPQIPHHRNHLEIKAVEGMTFTIEPMINAGEADAVIDKKDQWTARTIDGRASAQWEHTLLITSEGHEILTPWEKNRSWGP